MSVCLPDRFQREEKVAEKGLETGWAKVDIKWMGELVEWMLRKLCDYGSEAQSPKKTTIFWNGYLKCG